MKRLALLVVIAAGLVSAPAASAVAWPSGHGLTVTSVKQLNSRLVALTVKTAALPDPASVYILLPPGYDTHPRRHYPVFYLLDGTSGFASDWTHLGDAQQVIGNRPVITVMPDITLNGNGGGWCTDWPNGAQRWETFHIGQLLPWVDANLRTITTRAGRAIAGLSQGGFCSTSYAARHPDLFATALGYSGAPDIYFDPDARAGAKVVINATEVGLTGVPPDTFFGDQTSDGINWAAHDPATLAENLRWTRMYMYWGNGQNGPFDSGVNPAGTGIEGAIWGDNNDFQKRLNALQIPAYFDAYGPGTHTWPYWKRDLEWSIDKIMFNFAHPAPAPSQFTYTSADDVYTVYGWQVSPHRTAREFSTLAGSGRAGFSLSGSGSASVRTTAVYAPGRSYAVRLSGDQTPDHTIRVRAGANRRLTLSVPLGPPNPYQEDTAQAQSAGTAVFTTRVTISRTQR